MPTLDLGGMTLGLREGLIGLIVLVAVYIVFVLLRMFHLRQKRPQAVPENPVTASSVAPAFTPEEAPSSRFDEASGTVPAPAWEPVPAGMAADVLRSGLEQELAQLRDEVDAMRGELAALRSDMHQELAALRASQSVSPIYGDAMQLAVSGYDAAAIAERCGIARAEADLVVALAKSQEH